MQYKIEKVFVNF